MVRHIQVIVAVAAVAMSVSVLRGQTLTKVEKESAYLLWGRLYDDPYEDVIPWTRAGNEEVYRLTFAANEPFVFLVPESLLIRGVPGPLLAMGQTPYTYDDDGDPATPPVPYNMPNKLLRIRQALLDAKTHYEAELKRFGIVPTYYKPGEPFTVFVGYFRPESRWMDAFTNSWSKTIHIPHDLDPAQVETAPVHELFHTLQKVVAATPITLSEYKAMDAEEARAWRGLNEMTCQWATDEAIRIAHTVPPGPLNLDTVNVYAPTLFWFQFAARSLFERSPYANVHLIKYLAEQINGGQDASAAREIFKLHQSIPKPAESIKVLEAIAGQLPAGSYPGPWQQKWRRFFRNFCMTNIVQRGSPGHSPADVLGYHDDAFTALNRMYLIKFTEHHEDYLTRPSRLYAEPAADDAERCRRLATLASDPIRVSGLATDVQLINLSDSSSPRRADGRLDPRRNWRHDDVAPRAVFLYAKGQAGADVFALHQASGGRNHLDRARSAFVLNPDFKLSETDRTAVAANPNVTTEGRSDYLWVGLVNSEPEAEMRDREFTWAYAATPGLVPLTAAAQAAMNRRGSLTVQHVRGDALRRPVVEGFYNGDRFVLKIRSTGLLHAGADAETDIPPEKRTLRVEILHEKPGEIVQLVRSGGRTLKVSCTRPAVLYQYRIEGQIDPDNPVVGRCRARLRWTSLLNLGKDDECVDESYSFFVRDPRPGVEQVEVLSGPTVIYDSKTGRAIPPQPTGSEYNLAIKVTFSQKMKAAGAQVSAGPAAPYNAYPVAPLVWSADGLSCKGLLTVPVADGGKAGRVAWLSISAVSDKGVRLDANAEVAGDQPNTRHFILLGARDFYGLTFQAHARSLHDAPGGRQTATSAQFKPLELKMLLMSNDRRWHFAGPVDIPGLMQTYQERLAGLEKSIPTHKKNIAHWERVKEGMANPPAHVDPAIAVLKGKLAAARDELKALHAFRGNVDSLARVLNGFRIYGYSRQESGPVAARFAGARWEHTMDIRSEGYTAHRSIRMDAPPWATSDIASIGWNGSNSYFDSHHPLDPPVLMVWEFDARDIDALRDALAAPQALPASHFVDMYYLMLRETAAGMWCAAYPERLRPAVLAGSPADASKRLTQKPPPRFGFPTMVNPRLMRLELSTRMFRDAPLEARGTDAEIVRPHGGPPTRRSRALDAPRSFSSLRVTSPGSSLFPWPPGGTFPRRGLHLSGRSITQKFTWSVDAGIAERVEWRGENFAVCANPVRPRLAGTLTRRLRDSDWIHSGSFTWRLTRNGYGDTSAGTAGGGSGTPPGGASSTPSGGGSAAPGPPTSPPTSQPAGAAAPGHAGLPGTVTGALTGLGGLKAGRVVVYLTGPNLPASQPQTRTVDLKTDFTGGLLVLPVGSSIQFVNSTSQPHRPVSRSSLGRFDVTIERGKSETVTFAKPGKIRVSDAAQRGSALKLLIVPNAHFAEVTNGVFQLETVPPGAHVLHVVTEDPRVRPSDREVIVPAGTTAAVDVPLARGQ